MLSNDVTLTYMDTYRDVECMPAYTYRHIGKIAAEAERGACIESVPAEPEDEGPERLQRLVA